MARRSKNAKRLRTSADMLGTALGQVARRLDAWKKERAEIARDINHVMLSARAMLGDLGNSAAGAADAIIRPKGKGGRPKGYKMSEATKRKLRAAWKRRKASAKSKETANA